MRSKLIEVWDGEEMVFKGKAKEAADYLKIGVKSFWNYYHQGSKVFRRYRLEFGGYEQPKEKHKLIEEPYDYMFWQLTNYGNTVINSRDINEVERLQDALGKQIKTTKILNINGTLKKGRPSYHYLLEVEGEI